jgi:hypothetical protein
MPQICDIGQTTLLPLRRKACCVFFRPKKYSMILLRDVTHITQKIPSTSLDGFCGLQKIEVPRIFRQLTYKDGKVFSTVHQEKNLVLASAALLTTLPWCARKIYVNEKFK